MATADATFTVRVKFDPAWQDIMFRLALSKRCEKCDRPQNLHRSRHNSDPTRRAVCP